MSADVAERIEGKIDKQIVGGVQLRRAGGGLVLQPNNVAEALELAKVLSTARGMIPDHLVGNPGACADVVFQALQWGMNPFALAKQSYIAGRGMPPAYMAQALVAAVNANAGLIERLRYSFAGEGAKRTCTVSGVFKGSGQPHEYTSPEIGQITPKNSPLWKADPDRQLSYWSARAWARLYAADVLMGVYADDELTPDMAREPEKPQFDPFAGDGPRAIGGGRNADTPAAVPLPRDADSSPASQLAGASSEAIDDAPAFSGGPAQ